MGVRALLYVFLCLVALRSVGCLAMPDGVEARQLGLADIPQCGLQCILLNIADSGCDLTDYECQCGNTALGKTVSSCMLMNCTMDDALRLSKVQHDMCGLPDNSKSHEIFVCTCITFTIAVVFVSMRITSKVITKKVKKEDYLIIVSLLISAAAIACLLKMTFIGFGEHLWNLEPGRLLENLRYFYITWSTYIIVLALIKFSLIYFYLEIFRGSTVRIVAYCIMAWIVVTTIILYIMTIFVCKPLNSFWDRDIKGKCMDLNALAYATSGMALAQDVVLFIFPLICIRPLKMQRRRKIAVGFMFCIGAFGIVASVVRLQSLLSFRDTIDPTWDYAPVTIWTEIELACVYACLSFSAIRVLVRRWFPNSSCMPSTMNRSNESDDLQPPKAVNLSTTGSSTISKKKSWLGLGIGGQGSRNSTMVTWPAGWSPRPWSGPLNSQTSQRSRSKNHRRLESDGGTDEDLAHITAPTPTGSEQNRGSEDDVEMVILPERPHRERCRSCKPKESRVPSLGYLPDKNYSDSDLNNHAMTGGMVMDKCVLKEQSSHHCTCMHNA